MRHTILFLAIFVALFGTTVYSQDGPPQPPMDGAQDGRPGARRPNLLAELGLSPEQLQQIRKLNQDQRPALMAARRRMGDAMRNLDMAIYADNVNDAEIQLRLKEFQAAEAEISRLRFESELAVRKLLNPDQLVKFREVRRRFQEMRRNMENRRQRRNGRQFPPAEGQPPQRPGN